MYHHHITHTLAEAHVADMQRIAAHNRQTSSVRRRHRLHAMAAALVAIWGLL